MKFTFAKIWLIVVSYDTVDDQHSYHLWEPQRNVHISLLTPKKLPSKSNQWVRVGGTITCDKTNPDTKGFRNLLCNSVDLQHVPCKSFMYVNGYNYCTEIE